MFVGVRVFVMWDISIINGVKLAVSSLNIKKKTFIAWVYASHCKLKHSLCYTLKYLNSYCIYWKICHFSIFQCSKALKCSKGDEKPCTILSVCFTKEWIVLCEYFILTLSKSKQNSTFKNTWSDWTVTNRTKYCISSFVYISSVYFFPLKYLCNTKVMCKVLEKSCLGFCLICMQSRCF